MITYMIGRIAKTTSRPSIYMYKIHVCKSLIAWYIYFLYTSHDIHIEDYPTTLVGMCVYVTVQRFWVSTVFLYGFTRNSTYTSFIKDAIEIVLYIDTNQLQKTVATTIMFRCISLCPSACREILMFSNCYKC